MVEVYRVENCSGKGPYSDSGRIWQEGFHNVDTGRPDPIDDFPPDVYLGINIHEYIFGFKCIEDLNNWFTDNEIRNLKKEGFEIVKKKAKEVIEGGRQVMFKPL